MRKVSVKNVFFTIVCWVVISIGLLFLMTGGLIMALYFLEDYNIRHLKAGGTLILTGLVIVIPFSKILYKKYKLKKIETKLSDFFNTIENETAALIENRKTLLELRKTISETNKFIINKDEILEMLKVIEERGDSHRSYLSDLKKDILGFSSTVDINILLSKIKEFDMKNGEHNSEMEELLIEFKKLKS